MTRTRTSHGSMALLAVMVLPASWLAAGPAAGAPQTVLTLAGPPSAVADATFTLTATLRSDGKAVRGADVRFERQVGDGWVEEASGETGADGTATATFAQDPAAAPAVLR